MTTANQDHPMLERCLAGMKTGAGTKTEAGTKRGAGRARAIGEAMGSSSFLQTKIEDILLSGNLSRRYNPGSITVRRVFFPFSLGGYDRPSIGWFVSQTGLQILRNAIFR